MTSASAFATPDATVPIPTWPTSLTVTFSFGEIAGADYAPLSNLLNFGDISEDVILTPGSYALAIGDSLDDTIEAYDPVTLFEGDRILAIAHGEIGTASFGIEFIDTTTTPWTTSLINLAP